VELPHPDILGEPPLALPGITGAELGDPSGVLRGGMKGVFDMIY